jgi:hypothetical protein
MNEKLRDQCCRIRSCRCRLLHVEAKDKKVAIVFVFVRTPSKRVRPQGK